MTWLKQSRPSPTPRRRILGLDCLEDRFAPAVLGSFGQTFIDAAPAALVAESSVSPIAQFAIGQLASPASIIGNVARVDDGPIGFFHRFCQNGFVSGEMIEIEHAPPRPRPVQPPLQPAAAALARPLALPEIVETPFAVTPPAAVLPPAAVEAPAPLPPQLEIIPATYSRPAPSSIAAHEEEQSAPFVIDDQLATAVFANDTDAVTPASYTSRSGLAAFGGLMAAASLLYVRNVRERRYEEFITYGH